MNGRAGVQERYMRSADTSDLTVSLTSPSDADVLMAAAFASSHSKRRRLALRVNRIMMRGPMVGAHDLSMDLGAMLRTRMIRNRLGRSNRIPNLLETAKMSMLVLHWLRHPTCATCHGRKHPTIPGTPHLDTSRACSECHGTGVRPVERLVRTEYADDVRWLVSEIEGLMRLVLHDMGRIMKG